MNNPPRPQYGNNPVGFVYFQNSPCETSTSGTSETLDYIEFSNTPSTTAGFQPGHSSSPQQFRQRNSRYHKGNRNKNYRQFHSNVNYQGNKQFSPNQNQSYNPRGNYSPRGNFNSRGRGNFTPRGNYNSRGYFRNQNKNKKKPYDKSDIRKYVNRSMIENPWEKLMSSIKITLKPSGSSNLRTSTVTSGDSKDECMMFDSNLSESTEQFNVELKSTNSEDLSDEKISALSDSDKNVINSKESVAQPDTNSATSNLRTSTVTSGDSKDECMMFDSNLSESTKQLNVEPKSTNSEGLTDEKILALSDSDKNIIHSTESVSKPDTNSATLDIPE